MGFIAHRSLLRKLAVNDDAFPVVFGRWTMGSNRELSKKTKANDLMADEFSDFVGNRPAYCINGR